MTDYYCGFCNNKFWNKSNLDKHQKTAKYCLAIQIKNTNIEVLDNNKLIERKVNDKDLVLYKNKTHKEFI